MDISPLDRMRGLLHRTAAGERTPITVITNPLARILWRIGYRFDFVGGFTLSRVSDAAAYQPAFSPWSLESWRQDLRVGDGRSLVSPERRYFLGQMLRQTLRSIDGLVAECGVYRGGTAYVMARIMQDESPERRLQLFDTFAGMPETDPSRDIHVRGDFADTALADVERYLGGFDNVEFFPGMIPQTFASLSEGRYAFVHIDLDIYSAVLDSTRFFYDRLTTGGVIVYDDYGLPSCPGARQAVDEFFADKPEVPIVLSSGHCFIIKIAVPKRAD